MNYAAMLAKARKDSSEHVAASGLSGPYARRMAAWRTLESYLQMALPEVPMEELGALVPVMSMEEDPAFQSHMRRMAEAMDQPRGFFGRFFR